MNQREAKRQFGRFRAAQAKGDKSAIVESLRALEEVLNRKPVKVGHRLTKFTPEKRGRFLALLADGQSVTAAAQSIGMSRVALYNIREQDEEFKRDWRDAYESGTDTLEDEAARRAKDSSDTLLIFLLKGRRPEKYRERVTIDVNKLDADIERELALITAGGQAASTSETEGETVH